MQLHQNRLPTQLLSQAQPTHPLLLVATLVTTICTDKTVTTRHYESWPKTFGQQPEECLLQCQGFNSFAPCNSLHSTNSTYHRHERGKGKRMSREPSTSNMEPSPQWSYLQVVDGPLCHGCLRRLAGLIATKHSQLYVMTLSFIKCKTGLNYILRSWRRNHQGWW